MEHAFRQKVFYSDTDAYGVVWHGNYLRWLEMGRVYLCEKFGLYLKELENQDIVMPVREMNIKYKISAKLDDIITVRTKIADITKAYIVFHQIIADENEEKTYIDATFKVVAIHKDGTLYRSLPEQFEKMVKKSALAPV